MPVSHGPRVSVTQIVQRVGGRRGALGGWVAPLDSIAEPLRAELQHPDLPFDFPATTTGEQSLDFVLRTWRRAGLAPEGLANEVRDVLPMAYAYCLDDCTEDSSLLTRWTAAKPDAMVFAEREWILLAESDGTYLDDIADRRFIPTDAPVRIVTAGHLGRSREEQRRTADAMDLPLLSSTVTQDWHVQDGIPAKDDWKARFAIVYGLLQRVRKTERPERDGTGSDNGSPPELLSAPKLSVEVHVGGNPPQQVPVNARLHERILTVSGRPVEFGADAAKELLREFTLGQRADLAADLTGMLSAIDNDVDFRLSVDKFGRSHVSDYESTDVSQDDETTDAPNELSDATDTNQADGQKETDTADTDSPTGHLDRSDPSRRPDTEATDTSHGIPKASDSTGGSYTRDRALAKQNALAEELKKSLKGEIAPLDEHDETATPQTTTGNSSGDLGDEEYRQVAARYEREANREPELGDPHQVGWDIRSVDPETNEVRLIEVKGKGCCWDGAEVVQLSRAQVRESFNAADGQSAGSWYLYVVEKTAEDSFRVLPIENPAHTATAWILSGKAWRMEAENPKQIDVVPSYRVG